MLKSPANLRMRLSRRRIAELARILRLVRSATGVDFTHYKHGTLARRIKRRMALRGFETLEDYSRDLEQNRDEANALCENCFITVTAFFREPAVFEELKKGVSPLWSENRAPRIPSGSGCLGAPRARRLIPSPSA
jgi:two-component system, chemotaxis family, CheB/CheR fusion protein